MRLTRTTIAMQTNVIRRPMKGAGGAMLLAGAGGVPTLGIVANAISGAIRQQIARKNKMNRFRV